MKKLRTIVLSLLIALLPLTTSIAANASTTIEMHAGQGYAALTGHTKGGGLDIYYFTPPTTGDYVIQTLRGTTFDTYGVIRNLDTRQIYEDDNSGSGNNFRIEAHLTAGTRYRLMINGSTDDDYGKYLLSIKIPN